MATGALTAVSLILISISMILTGVSRSIARRRLSDQRSSDDESHRPRRIRSSVETCLRRGGTERPGDGP